MNSDIYDVEFYTNYLFVYFCLFRQCPIPLTTIAFLVGTEGRANTSLPLGPPNQWELSKNLVLDLTNSTPCCSVSEIQWCFQHSKAVGIYTDYKYMKNRLS